MGKRLKCFFSPLMTEPQDKELIQLAGKFFNFRGNSHGNSWFATSIEAKQDPITSLIAFANAVLEKWGRASMDDDDCISPQDLHDIACSLSEGRKGLRKHIVYFQDEGKDKGIGVWAKNEEEAEVLAMEKYCQLKKARAT